MDNSNEIKAILVGKSGVGKTNLINTCGGFPFNSSSTPTTTNTFIQKRFTIDKKEYIINLWDTMGQEQYLSINKIFYKGAEIVIFVFDITDKESLYDIDNWIKTIKEEIGSNFVCGIVGNKKDLFLKEQVNEEEAAKYAKSKGIKCKILSCKTSPNAFPDFLKQIITEPMCENKLKSDNEGKNSNYVRQNSNMTVLNRKRGVTIKLQKTEKKQENKGNKWFC